MKKRKPILVIIPRANSAPFLYFFANLFGGLKKGKGCFFFVFGYLRRFMVIAAATTTIMIIAAAMPM
jgi:hypothetical protein